MRIVHIAPNAPYNDYWGYQDNLLPKYHSKLGNDVTLITTDLMHKNGSIVKTDCNDYVLNDKVRVIRLARREYKSRVLTNLRARLDVYNILCEIKPDCIFFHGLISTTIYDVIKYKKSNRNCVVFQDNHLDYNNGYGSSTVKEKIIRAFYIQLNKRSCPYVERVYGVTPWRKKYAEDYFKIPESKTDVLIMGADDEKINFENRSEVRTVIRDKYKIADSDFLVVTGGKIDQTKNIHLLAEAVAKTGAENLKLLIFGKPDSNMEPVINKLCEDKHIINIGWVDSGDVYNYFLAADLVVFPGTHSVLWEQACACGVPCLFKSWEGMHHVCVNNNSDFLYKDSAEEIAAKIKELLNDPQKYGEMKKAAEQCRDKFLYSSIAKKAIGIEK